MLLHAPSEHVRSKGIWSLRDVTLDQEKATTTKRKRRTTTSSRQHNTAQLVSSGTPTFTPAPLPLPPKNRVRRTQTRCGTASAPCAVLVGFLSVHVGFFPSLTVGNLVFVKMSSKNYWAVLNLCGPLELQKLPVSFKSIPI